MTQYYCNVYYVLGWWWSFFLKQWHIYILNACFVTCAVVMVVVAVVEWTWYNGCTCMVCMVVVVAKVVVVSTWYSGCMVWPQDSPPLH